MELMYLNYETLTGSATTRIVVAHAMVAFVSILCMA